MQPNLPQVMGYAPVLDQVAKNLLDNALKYVEAGNQPVVKIGAFIAEPDNTESNATEKTQVCWFFPR